MTQTQIPAETDAGAARLAPFTYPGNKQKVAAEVWQRLTGTRSMIDPFAGSLALYAACPWREQLRVVVLGDLDGTLVNAWRAMQHDPTVLAEAREWPVDTFTVHAAGRERQARLEPMAAADLAGRLRADPRWYDRPLAVTTVYHLARSFSIRGGTTLDRPQRQLMARIDPETIRRALDPQRVTITPGSWDRTLTPGRINGAERNGPTVVFIDPPYTDSPADTYATQDASTATAAYRWAAEHGPELQIVAFGHADTAPELDDWDSIEWARRPGICGTTQTREDERAWFSPACQTQTPALFD